MFITQQHKAYSAPLLCTKHVDPNLFFSSINQIKNIVKQQKFKFLRQTEENLLNNFKLLNEPLFVDNFSVSLLLILLLSIQVPSMTLKCKKLSIRGPTLKFSFDSDFLSFLFNREIV